jgi:Flp pilus assembly protein TadG
MPALRALAARLRQALRRRARAAAALEFSLTVPIIGVALMGVADYANALQHMIRLEGAARAGAQILFTQPGQIDAAGAIPAPAESNAARKPAAEAATQAFLPGWTVSTAPDCESATTGTAVCLRAWTWCQCSGDPVIRANARRCDAACPSGQTMQQFGSVTASRPFSPLITAPVDRVVGNVELRIR